VIIFVFNIGGSELTALNRSSYKIAEKVIELCYVAKAFRELAAKAELLADEIQNNLPENWHSDSPYDALTGQKRA
jgi:hypothetical protein